jgi:hypothetical protein
MGHKLCVCAEIRLEELIMNFNFKWLCKKKVSDLNSDINYIL